MIDCCLNRTKAKRGIDLPQSKLNESDVIMIRELVAYRDELKSEISTLTNKKLAEKFGVHFRTIDAITAGITWTHV